MSLRQYFSNLIEKVDSSEVISNAGKDDNGFFKPTRTILLRNLNLLKDLHDKPLAKEMVRAAWSSVVKDLPPEWLILSAEEKTELKKILDDDL